MIALPRHASALFISDLHLTPERPDITARFLAFLAGHTAEALFILGDFFELWVGDDSLDDPFHRTIAETLKRRAEAGERLYFQHGNRDFLIGEAFAAAAGVTLLPDPCVVQLADRPTLISHGDLLCTDDAEYQSWRRQTRQPAWQAAFLARPLEERLAFARDVRVKSEAGKTAKAMEIMDVNPAAVAELMASQGVSRLIHGHTHRPARHELEQGRAERWVLPDWDRSGGGLSCDASGCQVISLT
jgi:UDP-2,3-diacylglucosamine hydrolase